MNKKEKRLSAYEERRPGEEKPIIVKIDPDANLVKLRDLHRNTIAAALNTIRNAILTGEELLRIKSELSHGKFIPYIELNKNFIGFDRRMASNYIRFYDNRELVKNASSIREALKMISQLDQKEKEINPIEKPDQAPKILYSKFKSGLTLNQKEKRILKDFLYQEREKLLSLTKTKISELDKDINSI